MIKSKEDLKQYLEEDRLALGKTMDDHPKLFGDEIWKFEIYLRKCEYYSMRQKTVWGGVIGLYYRFQLHRLSFKLGYSIPLNVVGPGLSLPHRGTIVINSHASIGENCRIHVDVNIGATGGSTEAPFIGSNCYIGPGAKLVGNISIADNVIIGANAVVVKSINEPGTTWAGVPAKKISDKGAHHGLMLI